MKSLCLAAVAALLVNVGYAAEPTAKPVLGAPLMFKVGGEYKPVLLSGKPWSASSTGSKETAYIEGERYFPEDTYLRARHEGKSVVLRWQASGLNGGSAGWYAYEGEPRASAPANTSVVTSETATTVCGADGTCPLAAPKVVSGSVVYTTCNGVDCLTPPVEYFGAEILGSAFPSVGIRQPAPVLEYCRDGSCNKGKPAITFPYSFR